ncbi:MAG: tetratricopeptide repeat protein [Saprospiraceae bacterium]|nr:tetratricopeptide repeat protein [Saprospiraceae bacterium]
MTRKDHKYKFILHVIMLTLYTNVYGQATDLFEKRVAYFDKKFGRGNAFTQQKDINEALSFKDSLVRSQKYDLIAEHWKTLGKMYQQIGRMSSAEKSFLASIQAGQQGKDSIWVANTYSRLGSFYSTENRVFPALECQLKALELLEKYEKPQKSVPEVYNDIAKAYIQLGDLTTAEQYLGKSVRLKKELNDTLRMGIITTLYADIYRMKGDFKKAEEYYQKDIPKRLRQKNYEGLVISYHGLGDTYLAWNKYDAAEITYMKALQAADTIKRYRTIGLSLVKLGNLYLKTGKFDEAEKAFKRAITECTQVDSRVYQLSAYYAMYELNKSRGNVTEALQFMEKYTEINQLNARESMQLKSDDMKAAYELKERENELIRLDAENKKNAQTQQILIIGIAILLLLSGFLIYLYFARNILLKSLSKSQQNTQKLLNEKEELYSNLEATHHHLVHSEKMASIGTMTAGIAHELNNPVSSIHASAEALKMDYEELRPLFKILKEIKLSNDSDDLLKIKEALSFIDIDYITIELQTLLNTIMNGSQRTSEIIKGLKTFARDSGEVRQSYKIEEGIDAALLLLHHKMKDQIIIHKSYHFGKSITCNVSKINQVFLNILDNAIQAMSEYGILTIETMHEHEQCIIRISDNGFGMDLTTQKKIFEPFFTTKEIGNGTGLGLAISYAIIKEHHGDIKVTSEPAKGTTFVVSLPL